MNHLKQNWIGIALLSLLTGCSNDRKTDASKTSSAVPTSANQGEPELLSAGSYAKHPTPSPQGAPNSSTPTPSVPANASLQVSPQLYFQFGKVPNGERRVSYEFTITNNGLQPATDVVLSIASSLVPEVGENPFAMSGTCIVPNLSLKTQEACSVSFSFAPYRAGYVKGAVGIEYKSEGKIKKMVLQLAGTGIE